MASGMLLEGALRRLMAQKTMAKRRRQQLTDKERGQSVVKRWRGASLGSVPLEVVSQVEITLTSKTKTTEVPRNPASFHSQRQSRIHQGSDSSFWEESLCCCSDMTLAPSFPNCFL